MFEVCKSKQQTQLQEEAVTRNPTTLHPQRSSVIAHCLRDQTEQGCQAEVFSSPFVSSLQGPHFSE